MSSRDRWQSVQSVCSCLTAVGNCSADDIYVVTQTNGAVSACALFHVSDHLLLSLKAGGYKRRTSHNSFTNISVACPDL